MNWTMVVGSGLAVALLTALIMSGWRGKEVAAGRRMSSEQVSLMMRDLWDRGDQALRAYMDARGDAVAPAREHLLRVADETAASVPPVGMPGLPERYIRMWQLAAEEIRDSANDAIARHPEEQRN